MNVLFVEDSESIRQMVSYFLHEKNVETEEASTLSIALERMKYPGIDLVLLDLNLPNSEGIETAKTMQQASYAQVVVLSGDKYQKKAVEQMGLEFIEKTSKNLFALPLRLLRYSMEKTSDRIKRDRKSNGNNNCIESSTRINRN